jgi:hypothetical protein
VDVKDCQKRAVVHQRLHRRAAARADRVDGGMQDHHALGIPKRTGGAQGYRGGQCRRYVRDGKFVSAAGVSAGIDMNVWLVGQMFGKQVAREAQAYMEYDPEPPYDIQKRIGCASPLNAE